MRFHFEYGRGRETPFVRDGFSEENISESNRYAGSEASADVQNAVPGVSYLTLHYAMPAFASCRCCECLTGRLGALCCTARQSG